MGFDVSEAGPSRPRPTSFPSSRNNKTSNGLGLDHGFISLNGELDQEEQEEFYREAEVSKVEDDISINSTPHRPTFHSELSPGQTSITPRIPSLDRIAPLSAQPSQKPRLKNRLSSYNASINLGPLDLSLARGLKSSVSEVFGGMEIPRLPRRTTYSSLPPSPIFDLGDDGGHDDVDDIYVQEQQRDSLESGLEVGKRNLERRRSSTKSQNKGLNINRIEGILTGINDTSPEQPTHGDEDGVSASRTDEPMETFWPARSRSGTLTDDVRPTSPSSDVLTERDVRSPSPETEFEVDGQSPRRRGDDEFPSRTEREVSLWELLKDEVGAEGWEGWVVDGKWERIQNFLAVPLAVERVTLFGALLCLDGFLYNFTILPIRATFATARIFKHLLFRRKSPFPLPPTHLHSLLRMALMFIPTVILLMATDASKMYHTVRGQDTIKLYVIFNALEIADRLCCAFGQDVLDTLFARNTLAPPEKLGVGRKRRQARPYFFFALSSIYVLAHTLIYFYMLVSLNVAINSYDYTLLSLLISNQFVEIKGSVFKKFDKENLFQIMCADIVERFQLSLMLTVIAIRNVIEMSGSEIAFLPKSFIRGKGLVDSILSPVLFVIFSEMAVDWLKHAFITKFNHIRATVYGRFADVLAKDVLLAGNFATSNRRKGRSTNHPLLLDQSPLVARRLGFASIPLACLVLRIGVQALGMLTTSSHHSDEMPSQTWEDVLWDMFKWIAGVGVGLSAWGCLVALKVLLGLLLLSYSALRQSGMEEREAEDIVNDFGRAAVGESREEKEYNKQTRAFLAKSNDELPEYQAISPTTAWTPGTAKLNGHLNHLDSPYDSKLSPLSSRTSGGRAQGADSSFLSMSDITMKEGEKKDKAGGDRKKWRLEDVERWTMVKRIW